MANDIGGVWRTVGGRRIFIKDGEDLETAMKKSGKFENKKETKFLSRSEMMDIVDRWSEKGFREQGAFGNDGYGKGVLHERYASGQLEGYGGENDDFVIKGFDMGSVNQKIALKELNKQLEKKGYVAKFTKEINSTSHQDIEIRKIKK